MGRFLAQSKDLTLGGLRGENVLAFFLESHVYSIVDSLIRIIPPQMVIFNLEMPPFYDYQGSISPLLFSKYVLKAHSRLQSSDDLRALGPFIKGESAAFLSLNRNKKSLGLNLHDDRGKKIFLQLVKKFDIAVENFRPGAMKKRGLDCPQILEKANKEKEEKKR